MGISSKSTMNLWIRKQLLPSSTSFLSLCYCFSLHLHCLRWSMSHIQLCQGLMVLQNQNMTLIWSNTCVNTSLTWDFSVFNKHRRGYSLFKAFSGAEWTSCFEAVLYQLTIWPIQTSTSTFQLMLYFRGAVSTFSNLIFIYRSILKLAARDGFS